ncbi:MAG TPA: hypothetical protein VIH57_00480 [Bacteroidales bacterium]
MDEKKNNIEELFTRRFENFEVKSTEEEWIRLNARLSKSNFLRFSFVTFNIYYLVVIAAFAGTASFMSIKNYHLSQEVKRLQRSVINYQQREQEKQLPRQRSDSTKFLPPAKETLESKETSTDHKNHIKQNKGQPVEPAPSVQNKVETEAFKVLKDSSKTSLPNITVVDTMEKSKARKVKKILVVKPKTVIIKDTVVITRSLNKK